MKNPGLTCKLRCCTNYPNNGLPSQTVISRGLLVKSNGYSYIWMMNTAELPLFQSIFSIKEQQSISTTDIQQNFECDFKIRNLEKNCLLIGLDFFNRSVVDNGSGFRTSVRHVTPQQAEVQYVDQATGDTTATGIFIPGFADNALVATDGSRQSNISKQFVSSAYVSDASILLLFLI